VICPPVISSVVLIDTVQIQQQLQFLKGLAEIRFRYCTAERFPAINELQFIFLKVMQWLMSGTTKFG